MGLANDCSAGRMHSSKFQNQTKKSRLTKNKLHRELKKAISGSSECLHHIFGSLMGQGKGGKGGKGTKQGYNFFGIVFFSPFLSSFFIVKPASERPFFFFF